MPDKRSEYIDFDDEESTLAPPLDQQGEEEDAAAEPPWHSADADEAPSPQDPTHSGQDEPLDEADQNYASAYGAFVDSAPVGEPRPFSAPEDEADRDADADLEEGIGRAAAVLKYMVERIVDDPASISIGASTDDRGPVLLLRVAEDDRGKVIGRQGRIVQALRTIVKAASVGSGERIGVEILD